MKKFMLTMIAAMTMSLAMAQNPSDGRPMNHPEPMTVEQITTQMQNKLGLTDEQFAKVKALNEKYADILKGHQGMRGQRPPRMENMDNSEQPQMTEEMKKMMEEHRAKKQAYEKELKSILSSSQYTTYQSMMPQRGHRGPAEGNDK
jgi:Skp family chaperone for outer membrane proteins